VLPVKGDEAEEEGDELRARAVLPGSSERDGRKWRSPGLPNAVADAVGGIAVVGGGGNAELRFCGLTP